MRAKQPPSVGEGGGEGEKRSSTNLAYHKEHLLLTLEFHSPTNCRGEILCFMKYIIIHYPKMLTNSFALSLLHNSSILKL